MHVSRLILCLAELRAMPCWQPGLVSLQQEECFFLYLVEGICGV